MCQPECCWGCLSLYNFVCGMATESEGLLLFSMDCIACEREVLGYSFSLSLFVHTDWLAHILPLCQLWGEEYIVEICVCILGRRKHYRFT